MFALIKVLKVLEVELWSVKRRCRKKCIYKYVSKTNPHHDRQLMMHQARMKYFQDHKFLLVLWRLIDSEYIIRSTKVSFPWSLIDISQIAWEEILFKAKRSCYPYADAAWQLSFQTNQYGVNKLHLFPEIKHKLENI